MKTTTELIFGEVRSAARMSIEQMERLVEQEGEEAPSDAELAIVEQLRKTLELTVLVVDNFLDE